MKNRMGVRKVSSHESWAMMITPPIIEPINCGQARWQIPPQMMQNGIISASRANPFIYDVFVVRIAESYISIHC